MKEIELAKEHFGRLIEEQFARIENMKKDNEFLSYESLDTIVIGIVGGDGIGPFITGEAQRVLAFLLKDQVQENKVRFKVIDGLTIENRAAQKTAIPADVLEELKQCHVILKGQIGRAHV